MANIPEYLVVGHVARDIVPGGKDRAGGTATYAALAASRLGLRVGVLTSAADDWPVLPDEPLIQVRRRPSASTTTFENIYTDGQRRQFLRAQAEVLRPADLPADWRLAPIVHLGPIAQEVDLAFVDTFGSAVIGVTPQGWLRSWDGEGLVSVVAWQQAERVLSCVDAVILSLEDLGGERALLERYVGLARLVVLTQGREGATVYWRGRAARTPAYDVPEVDPTGAGDVFATAFMIRLRQTGDPLEAARYANCVASFVVEGPGTSTIPTREQVERRLREGRLRL